MIPHDAQRGKSFGQPMGDFPAWIYCTDSKSFVEKVCCTVRKIYTILRTTDRETGASRHHGGSTDGPLKTHDKHDGRVPTGLRGSANSNSI